MQSAIMAVGAVHHMTKSAMMHAEHAVARVVLSTAHVACR